MAKKEVVQEPSPLETILPPKNSPPPPPVEPAKPPKKVVPVDPELMISRQELEYKKRTDNKDYKRIIKKLAADRLNKLESRLKSTTTYPQETTQKFRIERQAIKKGIWYPGFRLPRKKSETERFLESGGTMD